ncbi:MAG: ISNCY family transposase [candidate division Zixibacteria bacterium]|nr:ISNCY family transposase [candidate division Zixibacteria bacterium]
MAREDIVRMSLRELKKLKVLHAVLDKRFTQKAAAAKLDISERQVRRLVKSVREFGDEGVVHRSRGRPSNRKHPDGLRREVLKLYQQKYSDFGPTLASEKLLELDGLSVSRETLRHWLISSGLWQKRRKRRAHRRWRTRKECFGEMVQMDGSHHAWLEDRGPELVLMGYIDDATNRVYGRFYDYEGTLPAMDSFKRYVRRYGLPLSVYLDKHTTYKSNRRLTLEEELAGVSQPMSQFERALNELGVDVIHAHSPQAKGRIERLFGVLQDRLVKEMRLLSVTTVEEANACLSKYLRTYNRRFRVTPSIQTDVHVKPGHGFNLDRYLCIRTNRTVRNDNTIAHNGRLYQIADRVMSRQVVVQQRVNGSLHICSGEASLKYKEITKRAKKATEPKPPRVSSPSPLSPRDHPWRKMGTLKSDERKNTNQLTK